STFVICDHVTFHWSQAWHLTSLRGVGSTLRAGGPTGWKLSSSPKDEVAVATGLAPPLSSALKEQYDQHNEHERDEQDYQPPLSRRQQTCAGPIPGGNDPAAIVCQLHCIFVELTLGGRHLLKGRVLPP